MSDREAVIVTGASGGIGDGTARRLAEDGRALPNVRHPQRQP